MKANESKVIGITDFKIDRQMLLQSARIDAEDELSEELLAFANSAEKIAHPKAVFSKSVVTFDDAKKCVTKIGNEAVSCPLMDDQLQEVEFVYPYVATCGRELDEMDTQGDPLAVFWLECIQLQALAAVQKRVLEIVGEQLCTEEKRVSHLNPGSLPIWPISEQTTLFKLVEDPLKTIGVRLSDSFLMFPIKSVSGILFCGKEHYENCSYCSRQSCPNRRATFVGSPYGKVECDKQ